MDNPAAIANPYVGPRMFTSAERGLFFGRDAEARDLLSLVISQRLVLFYAQSGAGKSSLLNARLVPDLRERGFLVLPITRVGAEIPKGIEQVDNIYLLSLMLSLDQGGGDPARLAHLALPDFLARLTSEDGQHYYYADPVESAAVRPGDDHPAPDTTAQPGAGQYDEPNFVLVIDQFEEIFTTHTERWEERAEFFAQLDQAMRVDPQLWVLLTLREDYVAALDPYAHLLADKMRARYYMQRMGEEAALQAVQEPARLSGRPFESGVAEKLVENLRQIKDQAQTGPQLGQYVEPVQLQVVCYQLWENLKDRSPGPITEETLNQAGDVDNALSAFYEDAIHAALDQPGLQVPELDLRLWFNRELITEAGTRGTVFQGKDETAGMPNDIVRRLTDRYLLHVEPRAGGTWVELIHDRFVEPIRRANRDAEAKQKELEAAEKARQESAEALEAARLRELAQAQALAEEQRQRAEEQRQRAETELRSSRRLRRLVGALVVVSFLAFMAAAFGVSQARDANRAQATSESNRVASDSHAATADAAVAQLDARNRQLSAISGRLQLTIEANNAQGASAQVTVQAATAQAVRAAANAGTVFPGTTATAQAASDRAAATQAAAAQATLQVVNVQATQASAAQATVQAPIVGSTKARAADGMPMLYVPAGTFKMGSDTGEDIEKPVHDVTLDAFWIDRTEVTNAQYARCVSAGKCSPPSDTSSYTRNSYYGNSAYDNYPVIWVGWDDANNYCAWAGGQLPTEAQWEYAARGPNEFAYPWGNTADGTRLNYCDKNCPFDWADKTVDDGYADTSPVGNYSGGASWVGALDLAGNVWEITRDWYDRQQPYPAAPQTNPTGPAAGILRIIRSGSWQLELNNVRTTYRGVRAADRVVANNVGFRCAAAASPE